MWGIYCFAILIGFCSVTEAVGTPTGQGNERCADGHSLGLQNAFYGVPNRILLGQTYRNLTVASSVLCNRVCAIIESRCLSFQYSDQKKRCELNGATASRFPLAVKAEHCTDFMYYGPEKPHFVQAFVDAIEKQGIALTAYTKAVNNSECRTATESRPSEDGHSVAETAGSLIEGLPEYTQEDVSKHKKPETGIWMTYRNGVYDVTSFMKAHPGGGKIWLAAGGSLEPFWELYAVHKSEEVFEILEQYRIGNYKDAEKIQKRDVNDPFANDPYRHPALSVNSEKPFNAEPPPSLLIDSFITPNDLFFVRNHLPVPQCDTNNFRLTVEIPGKKPINLSLDNLKKNFKEHTIVATIQCAGNRRSQMSGYKKVKGLSWRFGAISTAEWTGVMLCDVLHQAGLREDDEAKFAHIQFEGLDKDSTGGHYGASIPFSVAMNPYRDVLLAYKMNGSEIPVDHGHPLRVVIPGNIGARSVKWLSKIVASDQESPSHWQQNDYKSFNPSVDFGQLDYKTAPAMQEYPVQSAICTPKDGSQVDIDEGTVTIKGYAWSGGGHGILRVDVSVDSGKEWHVAELQNADQKINRAWAWTLWEVDIPIPKDHGGKLDICCKAIDSSHNVQPDTMKGIWNVRGLLNTAWHRVNVNVVEED